MRKNVRIVSGLGILFVLMLLICGSAIAERSVDPNRDAVLQGEVLVNQLLDGPRRGGPLHDEDILSFTESTGPSLGGRGVWHIMRNDPQGNNAREMDVSLYMQDHNGSYTTLYRKTYEGQEIISTYTSCEIVSAGDYLLQVTVTYASGDKYYDNLKFTIADDVAHTSLEEKIVEIVTECKVEGDPWQTALNLHDWLIYHAYYDKNYEYYGADGVLLRGYGVCDSYSKAYVLLCEEANIPVSRVTGIAGESHAWNAVQIGGQWYHVDVTWDDPYDPESGDQIISGKENHEYFCLSDDLIGLDHQNDGAVFSTACTSLTDNYAIHSGEWRNYGGYWDESESVNRDYRDLILSSIPAVGGTFTVNADQDFPLAGGYYDYGNSSTAMKARYLYAYGLNRTGIELANGNLLEIEVSHNLSAENPQFTITVDGDHPDGIQQEDDGGIILRYDGTRLKNGDAVGGRIQYKFYVENLPEGCTKLQYGWSEDMSATAPAEEFGGWGDDWRELQMDEGGVYFYVMPDLFGDYNREVMFVRTGSEAAVRQIALYYNRQPVIQNLITFTNAAAPDYQEQDYTLSWSKADGAHFYYVVWEKPESETEWRFAGDDGLNLNSIPGATDTFGQYNVTVFAIANDRILQKSASWTFQILEGPELRVDPMNNAETVIVADDGSVTAPMHQWINFDVSAPGSEGVEVFWLESVPTDLSEEQSLNDLIDNGTLPGHARYTECRPGDEWGEFTWTPNDLPDGWTSGNYVNYVVAEARYEDGSKYKRVNIPVTVVVNTTITGTVEYRVQDGQIHIARDGLFIVEVDNTKNDADFYGAYILKDDFEGEVSDHYWNWLEDSHLATKESNQGTTQVQLQIPRCEANNQYVVHVYAVKFGAPQIESEDTTIIEAREAATDSPVIFSMKDVYKTGERLMIHACYPDPAPLESGWMNVQIWPEDEPWNIVYDRDGEWEDFYDVDAVIWEAGTYKAIARAMTFADGEERELAASPEKTITVSSSGTAVLPTIPDGFEVPNFAFNDGETFTICLPLNDNDTEKTYFAEIYGAQPGENEWEIDYENPVARAERTADGNFVFCMGFRDRRVAPGTYGVVFGSATPGKNASRDYDHVFCFDVRMDPTLKFDPKWQPSEREGIDYEIPVHTDFTVHINAYGATSAVLDMGGGYDQGPIELEGFDEWWNGDWGENHENISLDVWFDESCLNKGVDYFPMTVTAEYGNPKEDEKPARSSATKILCSSDGPIDVSEWKPVLYYAINPEGNVFVSCEKRDSAWEEYPAEGISIERGKYLLVLDLWESTHGENGNKGTDFFGALLGRDEQGEADWTHGMYDRDMTSGEDGWLTLSTIRYASPFSTTVDGSLWLSTWKEGYDSTPVTYPITVTDTLDNEGQVFWNFSEVGDRWTHDPINFSVYVPGAVHIDVMIRDEHGREIFCEGCDEDLFSFMDWEAESEAVLTFIASGEYDEESGKDPFEFTYPQKIRVQSNGQLPSPEVTLAGMENGTITEGQDVSFTFTEANDLDAFFANHKAEKNVSYNAFLFDEQGEMICEPMEDIAPDTPLSFDTEGLVSGCAYLLRVNIQQPRYSVNATDVWFLLLPEHTDQTPVVTLTTDGLNPDGKVPVNREVRFSLETDHPESIMSAWIFNGEDWKEFDDPDQDAEWGTGFSFTEDRTYPVYARVYMRGCQEPVLTNVILATGTKKGFVGSFTYSTDMENDAEGKIQLTRGECVTVCYHPAEHADHYWVDIEEYDADSHEWRWADHQADVFDDEATGGTALLFTAELTAGKRYRMFAIADSEGFIRAETSYTEFEVKEPEDGGVVVQVIAGEDNTIQTGDEIAVSVYAPGAYWIDLLYDADSNGDYFEQYDGNAFYVQKRPYWESGNYRMVARVWYPVFDENGQPVWETDDNGNPRVDEEDRRIQQHFSADSELVTIKVVADDGTLFIAEPENIPLYLTSGTDLNLTVSGPQTGLDWMRLNIDVRDEDGSMWNEPIISRETDENRIEEHISWDEMTEKEIHTGQTLFVLAEGGKRGYDIQGWERIIPIVEAPEDGLFEARISFDEKEGEIIDALVNTDIPLTIRPRAGRKPLAGEENTIQDVRIFDGTEFRWVDHQGQEDDLFRTEFTSGETGTVAVYAMITYMPWSDEWSGETGDPRVWYQTNVLTVNLNAEGTVGTFDFAAGQTKNVTFTRGDKAVFLLNPAENAEFYWVDIVDEGDDDNRYYPECMGDGTTVSVFTADLPAGKYRVRGRAGKEGYIHAQTESTVELTVEELPEGMVNLVLSSDVVQDETTGKQKTTVRTMEEINWSVYAPGAVSVKVKSWGMEDGEYEHVFREVRKDEGDNPEFFTDSTDLGGHEIEAYISATATYRNGEQKICEIEVEVIAPNGDLKKSDIRGGRWYTGEGLDFKIVPDSHAEWYQISDIWDATDGYRKSFYRTPMESKETKAKEFHLSTDELEGAVCIGMEIYEAAEGYNDCVTRVFIRAIKTEGSFKLPSSLKTIGDEAFAGDTSITHLVIPDKVTSIGSRAFQECLNLETIEIPASVTTFGENVFDDFRVTIYGHGGSVAETYAREKGIDFVNID